MSCAPSGPQRPARTRLRSSARPRTLERIGAGDRRNLPGGWSVRGRDGVLRRVTASRQVAHGPAAHARHGRRVDFRWRRHRPLVVDALAPGRTAHDSAISAFAFLWMPNQLPAFFVGIGVSPVQHTGSALGGARRDAVHHARDGLADVPQSWNTESPRHRGCVWRCRVLPSSRQACSFGQPGRSLGRKGQL